MEYSHDVYVAGALTSAPNLEELKRFYERIGLVCEEYGLRAFVPHMADDVVKPEENEIYDMDRKAVETAKLVLMYAGVKSFGVGQEAEIAKVAGVPVVLLCEEGKYISPMLAYCPSVVQVVRFSTWEDALQKVRKVLKACAKKK